MITDKIGHETLEILSHAESYNNWLYNSIKKYVGQSILEVGCGIGNLTELFKGRESVVSIDVDPCYIQHMKKRFSDFPNVSSRCLDITQLTQKEKFDTVICFNVLEHILNDQIALKKMHDALKKNGNLVLIVPAIEKLHNTLDINLGHYRRYGKADLKRKISLAGFSVTKMQHMNFPGIFGWLINGTILKREILPTKQVLLYNKIVHLVEMLERLIPPPIGLSLIAVGKKV